MPGLHEMHELHGDRWPEWLALIGGVWLAASPFVLDYAWVPEARTNALVVGILVAVVAATRAFKLTAPNVAWLIVLAGFWLLLAPSLLGFYFHLAAETTSLGLGMMFITMGILSAYVLRVAMTEHGGSMLFSAAEPGEKEQRPPQP